LIPLGAIVGVSAAHPACLGARMTGAGCGGCAVASVRDESTQEFVDSAAAAYTARTGLISHDYGYPATSSAEIVGPDTQRL
jgi:galactokinase